MDRHMQNPDGNDFTEFPELSTEHAAITSLCGHSSHAVRGHSWKLLTINTGLLLSTSKSGSMVCLHSFMNTFCTLFNHFVQKELMIH